MAGAGVDTSPYRKIGRPYPDTYDEVLFPKGYTVPKFKSFSGDGIKGANPEQHLAHFITSCANTGGNDALLLRQFPRSLTGPQEVKELSSRK